MANRIVLLAALILTSTAARGTQFYWTPKVYPVPVIPHGLDWSLQLAPDSKPAVARLSDKELAQIVPRVPLLEDAVISYEFNGFGRPLDNRPFGPLVAILIGFTFLLSAYDLIPRIQSQMLRLRLMNLQ